MKRVVLAGVVLVAASAAACSSPGSDAETATEMPVPEGVPGCDEVFAAGNVIDPNTFGDGCRTADDRLAVPRPAVLSCHDDRRLLWNDFAWGYEGSPMEVWPPDATEKVPMEQAMECLRDTDPAAVQPPPADGDDETDTDSSG